MLWHSAAPLALAYGLHLDKKKKRLIQIHSLTFAASSGLSLTVLSRFLPQTPSSPINEMTDHLINSLLDTLLPSILSAPPLLSTLLTWAFSFHMPPPGSFPTAYEQILDWVRPDPALPMLELLHVCSCMYTCSKMSLLFFWSGFLHVGFLDAAQSLPALTKHFQLSLYA